MESDRVLVGGGGNVEGGNSNIGALLIHSFGSPTAGGSWLAFSKDHVYSNPHNVRAWAVGLKLTGYTANQLASVITTTWAYSAGGEVANPAAVALTPQNQIMLGGGAVVNTAGAGQLLTAIMPTNAGWVGKSKDHIVSSPGSISVQTFSMPSCPAGLGYCVASRIGATSGPSPTGYHTQSAGPALYGSEVVIAPGGEAFFNGYGRMLSHLTPNPYYMGLSVLVSKDHGFVDTGTDVAAYVSLRRL